MGSVCCGSTITHTASKEKKEDNPLFIASTSDMNPDSIGPLSTEEAESRSSDGNASTNKSLQPDPRQPPPKIERSNMLKGKRPPPFEFDPVVTVAGAPPSHGKGLSRDQAFAFHRHQIRAALGELHSLESTGSTRAEPLEEPRRDDDEPELIALRASPCLLEGDYRWRLN